MSKKTTDRTETGDWPGMEAFRFWISFWPVAPLFGVEWRFRNLVPGMPEMPGETSPGRSRGNGPRSAAEEHVPAKRTAAAAPGKAEPGPKAEPAAPRAEPAPAEPPAKQEATVLPFEKGREAPAGGGEAAAGEEEGPSPEKPANLYAEAPSDADDLKLIKGIGPGLESQLNAIGVYRFDQIAELSEANLVWINENLTSFKGRCFRDDWVGQAKELMG